jgi:hypothetical protein
MYFTFLNVFKSFNVVNVDFITMKKKEEDSEKRISCLSMVLSFLFPYSSCFKGKTSMKDIEVQTDGKFLSFSNEVEMNSFFSNMRKASEWQSPTATKLHSLDPETA